MTDPSQPKSREPGLLPCPFCGGEADPEGWLSNDRSMASIHLRVAWPRSSLSTGNGFTRRAGTRKATRETKPTGPYKPRSAGLALPAFEDLPRGGIIGAATLKAIVYDTHPSPWFFGPVGLLLADVEPMPFRQFNGALGFFDVPPISGGENGR